MIEEKEKYINPFTDFGFKKLFGTEVNKDLLTKEEYAEYEHSKKIFNDYNNTINTAKEQGFEEGEAEGLAKG